MSRITAAAATMQTLSLAGMEEASRTGERTADIEHLLLALTLNEQVPGQVLRSLGVTLAQTRTAIAAQHADQLAALGIQTTMPEAGPIRLHDATGAVWSERALAVFREASTGKRSGDAADTLRALLDEPSGLIEAVLERLHTSTGAVAARLAEAERFAQRRSFVFDGPALAGTMESFVPARVDEVWAMLADPHRMPEWFPGVAAVFDLPAEVAVGATWEATAAAENPDSADQRVGTDKQTQRVTLTAMHEPDRLAWECSWPSLPRANRRQIAITLEPAAGGTHLLLKAAWMRQRPPRVWRLPLRWLLRPVYRFALWTQLSSLGAAIGRAFRA